MDFENANPEVVSVSKVKRIDPHPYDDDYAETIDGEEVFDLIRDIGDPEHPLTLEQLKVVCKEQIYVKNNLIRVEFTPTIPHCSMSTVIGLSIRVRLMRCLAPATKIDVYIKEGTHNSEKTINKQLNDKERCIAALENNHLLGVVNGCLRRCETE
eukprot:TRINITY_DN1052_c0_g1_i1.p1 TRINITY_DN1052_c0_g1~~TRINITY_DN1052_c0_g1_i1.p1  ORF type:complete len:155 (-),score=21.06 TRINITY_DN1052_c0_g1_i1:33-497(-)